MATGHRRHGSSKLLAMVRCRLVVYSVPRSGRGVGSREDARRGAEDYVPADGTADVRAGDKERMDMITVKVPVQDRTIEMLTSERVILTVGDVEMIIDKTSEGIQVQTANDVMVYDADKYQIVYFLHSKKRG